VKENIFSIGSSKFYHVTSLELIITRCWDGLAIHVRTVGRFEIDDKRLYDAFRIAESVLLLNEPVLYHGVLFGARGMFKGYVRNRAVTTYEVRTLAMYMEQIDLLITLENVKPPPNKRLASLRRFIIFEQSARSVRILDRVRRGREQA